MANRFASLDEYHQLILGHGVLAAMVFLFIIPASVMVRRFRGRDPFWTDRYHVYLNILAMFMVTIVFILGVMAVGPSRGLTNPHHGIGVAIFVLILIQVMGGSWVRGRLRKRVIRGLPVKLMLHQWIGRAIAILGIVQVPLGLTLYGSPKYLFVLYTLWMTFLLLVYFILSHRYARDYEYSHHDRSNHGGTVIEERKSGGIGRWLAPLAAGGALAALLSRRRSKRESGDSRPTEVISSRRGSRRDSGSFVEEEKFSEEGERRGGLMSKLLTGGAVLGAGALAKSWWDRRKRNRDEEEYSAVAPDTPSARRHRPRRDDESEYSEESRHERRERRDDRRGPILPGPGDPLAAATAISAAQSRPVSRPVTPQPAGRAGGRTRRDSWSSYDSRPSPSRREERHDHTARNTVLGAVGLAWLAKKYKDRKDRQEQERLDRIREQEAEDERRLETDRRRGNVPPKYTGDGAPGRRNSGRRTEVSESDISTDLTSSFVEPRRGGNMPPLAAGALAGAAGPSGATIPQSRSRHEIIQPVPVPPLEPRQFGESGSRIHSPARGRGAEAAVAGAALGAGAAAVAAEERRRRELSRSQQTVGSPPVSVKVKVHGDRDRNVTLRRLTEEEAAAERSSRRDQSRRRRAESVSSLSGTDVASNKRRYRRDQSAKRDAAEAAAEQRVEAGGARTPLSPPRPAFAAGRPPKDSSYFSGAPPAPPPPPESFGSPESHGAWSGVSPSGPSTAGGDPADRRRRRRLERSQRQASTVDYN
jgi:hypothetical protein